MVGLAVATGVGFAVGWVVGSGVATTTSAAVGPRFSDELAVLPLTATLPTMTTPMIAPTMAAAFLFK